MKKFAENMLDFIYESPTQFNAVAVSAEMLEKNGFEKLNPKENWKLEVGKKILHNKKFFSVSGI